MYAIVDSNIIFSAIISENDKYIDIFQKNKLYVPDIVLLELNKYEEKIIKKTKLEEIQFKKFIRNLFEDITVIPRFAISKENFIKAYELCKNFDEKDTPFIALSLEFNYPLWTNDKNIIENLGKMGIISFIDFNMLIN